MGISTTDSERYAYDHSSGQNAAAQKSDEYGQLEASHLQRMMASPVEALAQSKRIRQLQEYLNAYRGNYQMPDMEVIPRTRLASSDFSSSTTTTSRD